MRRYIAQIMHALINVVNPHTQSPHAQIMAMQRLCAAHATRMCNMACSFVSQQL